MINDRLNALVDYPFRRLADLLGGVDAPAGLDPIDMAIGEPRHPVPALVPETLAANAQLWGRYPPTQGTPEFRAAAAAWLKRRFALPEGMIAADRHVLPCNGTREALFTVALLAVPPAVGGQKPVVLMPDPFYQVYAGAAVMAGAKPVFVAATAEGGFLPDFAALPEDVLARTALAYLCTPANPQGTVADRRYLADLVALARRADFVLAIDACYCDIYTSHPPTGVFEACAGDPEPLDHVIAFHSLSKRSSVPGLRSGFVAGDAALIADYARLRAYTGGQTPLPVIAAATALWGDEAHVEANRALYQRKFAMAAERLEGRCGFYVPPGGFYLWLEVGDGEGATKRLWREAALRVMPGGYLSRGGGADAAPGAPYIRIAVVHDLATTEAALDRLERALAAPVGSGAD
jgi:N-succinyldiaminopimelate aminotransferase